MNGMVCCLSLLSYAKKMSDTMDKGCKVCGENINIMRANQSDWVFQRLESGKPSLTGKPRYCYGLVHRECMAPKEAVVEKVSERVIEG